MRWSPFDTGIAAGQQSEDGDSMQIGRRSNQPMPRRGLTPEQYRAKWSLRPDYPMAAPSYSEARSELA